MTSKHMSSAKRYAFPALTITDPKTDDLIATVYCWNNGKTTLIDNRTDKAVTNLIVPNAVSIEANPFKRGR